MLRQQVSLGRCAISSESGCAQFYGLQAGLLLLVHDANSSGRLGCFRQPYNDWGTPPPAGQHVNLCLSIIKNGTLRF